MSDPNTAMTAVGGPRATVGLNYPWGFDKYGLYFGPHWRPGEVPREEWMDNWLISLSKNLDMMTAQWGIRLVRIFLLCNAQTLGTSSNAEQIWAFPPTLDARFLEHLERMFKIFRQKECKSIPSILDFGIAEPMHRLERRHHIVTDPAMRTMFLDRVVTPFVEIGSRYRETIYAWEVMNEPSWLNAKIWPHFKKLISPAAGKSDINVFLRAVLDRIKAVDPQAKSTVGHRYFSDLQNYEVGDIPQFHYYPKWFRDPFRLDHIVPFTDPDTLPAVHGKSPKPILGEIAAGNQDEPWRELDGRDIPTARERVRERLILAEKKGYELVLVWPDENWKGDQTHDNLKLSSAAQQGLSDFKTRARK